MNTNNFKNVPCFIWEKFNIWGGWGINNDSFSSYEDPKNMAKYTIISLILIDFVPIFFIFNLFRRIFRRSFRFKKIPSSKKSQVDFRGGGGANTFQKIPKLKKVPTPLRGGIITTLD